MADPSSITAWRFLPSTSVSQHPLSPQNPVKRCKISFPVSDRASPRLSEPRESSENDVFDLSAVSVMAAANGEDINAEQWFDDSNRNVSSNRMVIDDDPPFYLDRTCLYSRETVNPGSVDGLVPTQHHLPKPQPRFYDMSVESSIGDYRSVIDDLTIENQRLRQELKRYEKLHYSHLQKEKLFEVRTPLLAPKKRKLEIALRDVAWSLENPPGTPLQPTMPFPMGQYPNISLTSKPSSLSTSNSRPVDSAYASMSASGKTSGSQLQPVESLRFHHPTSGRDPNMNRFLNDIGNLSKHPPLLTERAKKRMVVRRLEQLFTGKGASSTKHGQFLQQQEVSRSAAFADSGANRALDYRSVVEGSREAKIIPAKAKVPALLKIGNEQRIRLSLKNGAEQNANDRPSMQERISDQRPTRPLDLDPYRAQNATDNIEYIRHLGLEPPRLNTESSSGEDAGWVYLNLLMSMAQLHTINVTLDFVRRAVAAVSARFELSKDGCKVRWKGGSDGAGPSFDSDSCAPMETDSQSEDVTFPKDSRVHSRTATKHQNSGPSEQSSVGLEERGPTSSHSSNILDYSEHNSISFRKPDSEDRYKHYEQKDSIVSTGMAGETGNEDHRSTGLQIPALAFGDSQLRPRDGPIIFYSKAPFCTDLSGDLDEGATCDAIYPEDLRCVLGWPNTRGHDACELRRGKRYFLTSHGGLPDNEGAARTSSNDNHLDLESSRLRSQHVAPDRTKPFPLEASGIGGVRPQDNFVIEVKVRYQTFAYDIPYRLSYASHPYESSRALRSRSCELVNRIVMADPTELNRSRRTIGMKTHILSTGKTNLPPSSLPPPSYIFVPCSSGSGEENYDNKEDSNTADALVNSSRQGANFPTLSSLRVVSTDSLQAWSLDESDDSSIDMLAHARQLDPDTIAAREREFESNVAEAFNEEIPAGRSASIVGNRKVSFTTREHRTWTISESGDGGSEDEASSLDGTESCD